MTVPKRLMFGLALAATTACVAFPGVAGARAGDRTFQQTYPVASRLCAEIGAGKRRGRLRRFTPVVLVDCGALQRTFAAAQSAVLSARAAIQSAIAADRTAIAAACPLPLDTSPSCVHERASENPAIAALRKEGARAARRYYRTVEAARRKFWRAIRALPGGAHVRADAPIKEAES